MAKITLTDLANLQNETTAVNAINANNAAIEAAMEITLSRDGTSPNQMGATLDMNSNQIINLPAPLTANSALRYQDLVTFVGGGTVTNIPAGGNQYAVLQKTAATDYAVGWTNNAIQDTLRVGTPTAYIGVAGSAAQTTLTGPFYSSQTDPRLVVAFPTFDISNPNFYAANSINVSWAGNGYASALAVQSVVETTSSANLAYGGSAGGVTGGVLVKKMGADPWGLLGCIANTTDPASSEGAGVWGLVRIKGGQGTTSVDALRATSETDGTDHPRSGAIVFNNSATNAFTNGVLVCSAQTYGVRVGLTASEGGQNAATIMPTHPFSFFDKSGGLNTERFYVDSSGNVSVQNKYYFGSAKLAEVTGGFNIIYAPNGTSQLLVSDNTNTYLRGNNIFFTDYATTNTYGFWDSSGLHISASKNIIMSGATSGTISIVVPSVAGSNTITIPASTDTLIGKATTDELTNKTLTSSVGKGTWTASGTWTLPAITLGGTVSGGGNNLNNIIIGASTPLAGTFTTLVGTSGTHTGITSLGIRDTSAAFDVTVAATSTSALTAGRTLTLDLNNTSSTFKLTAASTITFPSGTVTLVDTTVTSLTSLTTLANNVAATGNGWGLAGATQTISLGGISTVARNTSTGEVTLSTNASNILINPSTGSVIIDSGTAIPAGGTAGLGLRFSSTSNFGVFFGSGVPTLSAAKGSLYLRSDGGSVADRAYINTNGSTTWTNLVTAA